MPPRFTLDDLPPQMREQARAQMGAPATGVSEASAVAVALQSTQQHGCSTEQILESVFAYEPAKKRSKYGNHPAEVDGIGFQSKWEAQRYVELRNQQDAGLITDLKLQQSFALEAWTNDCGPVRIGAWIADFTYRRVGVFIAEDAKSVATRAKELYRWKKKHFESQYGMQITEVERARKRATKGKSFGQ
jgi:hypothetical protein